MKTSKENHVIISCGGEKEPYTEGEEVSRERKQRWKMEVKIFYLFFLNST